MYKIGTINYFNLFSDEFNQGYYETEIDLKQIDPTIQSIEKFISSYKTIEISNLGNLQVECEPPNIENFIFDRSTNILNGTTGCDYVLGQLNNFVFKNEGQSQSNKINFENTISLYTDNIKVNDIQTFSIGYTNKKTDSITSIWNFYHYSQNLKYYDEQMYFAIKTSSFSDDNNIKLTETYLQAYYTNDMKLKIRFSKVIKPYLLFNRESYKPPYPNIQKMGNDKDITIDINNQNVLGIRNNTTSPIQITIKPR
ncbi:hypothetical protein C6B38_03195 [Spiroplasma sp. ChiS]|uniref:hypothetical protein n=1 Tax=Spiroplasma sp. ChiS TaxID=2099885 RepID=UPI000CF95459|nr:hypothetical protein [Spiroplasma sp. ChiS]PQP78911.1 hypothetical protein C6B38_03195 [Spiroplasma sp. ChiS]